MLLCVLLFSFFNGWFLSWPPECKKNITVASWPKEIIPFNHVYQSSPSEIVTHFCLFLQWLPHVSPVCRLLLLGTVWHLSVQEDCLPVWPPRDGLLRHLHVILGSDFLGVLEAKVGQLVTSLGLHGISGRAFEYSHLQLFCHSTMVSFLLGQFLSSQTTCFCIAILSSLVSTQDGIEKKFDIDILF